MKQRLAAIAWRLDAYAGHWLADDDLTAVTDWMAANRLQRCTAERPITVEHGRITYGQDRSKGNVLARHRDIALVTVPLRTAPPLVWQPACSPAVMAELCEVFRRHDWSAGFGGVCVDCSRTQTDAAGRLLCHRDDIAPWPCPPVRGALAKAGIPLPASADPHRPIRVLGDCLDPAVNAKAFG